MQSKDSATMAAALHSRSSYPRRNFRVRTTPCSTVPVCPRRRLPTTSAASVPRQAYRPNDRKLDHRGSRLASQLVAPLKPELSCRNDSHLTSSDRRTCDGYLVGGIRFHEDALTIAIRRVTDASAASMWSGEVHQRGEAVHVQRYRSREGGMCSYTSGQIAARVHVAR